jgi:hypothetical protein
MIGMSFLMCGEALRAWMSERMLASTSPGDHGQSISSSVRTTKICDDYLLVC